MLVLVCLELYGGLNRYVSLDSLSKGMALLGSMALLEDVCHCGDVSYVQVMPCVGHRLLLPAYQDVKPTAPSLALSTTCMLPLIP